MVLGTPLYMSPEQARGDDELDHRVDIYALGVIMYEASTGRVPFSGNNYLSVISQVLNEQPTAPREIRPELTDEFEAIVLKAMTKHRNDRYKTADEMLADVNALLDDPTHSTERAKITGPRKKLPAKSSGRYFLYIGAVAAVASVLVIAVTQLMKSSPKKRVVADAGIVAEVVTDAASVAPPIVVDAAIESIKIKITSKPTGADVTINGENVGKTPIEIPFVADNKQVTGSMVLPNYDEAEFSFNPYERKLQNKTEFSVTLKKARAGQAPVRLNKPANTTPGSGTKPPTNNTNPDFTPNPFTGSGTVPKK
jgi:hypothetical protein